MNHSFDELIRDNIENRHRSYLSINKNDYDGSLSELSNFNADVCIFS